MPALVNLFLNILFMPEQDREDQSPVQHWRSRYMSDSTVFHALSFSQLARSSVTEDDLKPINRKAYWYCYSEIVREVNRRFSDVSLRCSDETILAVLTLAFHGEISKYETDITKSPAQGPMNAMQGLDLYSSRLDPVNMHVDGLAKMLALRGDISNIEFPGLAAMLS